MARWFLRLESGRQLHTEWMRRQAAKELAWRVDWFGHVHGFATGEPWDGERVISARLESRD